MPTIGSNVLTTDARLNNAENVESLHSTLVSLVMNMTNWFLVDTAMKVLNTQSISKKTHFRIHVQSTCLASKKLKMPVSTYSHVAIAAVESKMKTHTHNARNKIVRKSEKEKSEIWIACSANPASTVAHPLGPAAAIFSTPIA